jgi:solute carrier family 25 carnitine/acylcarnitine transporter 20/29
MYTPIKFIQDGGFFACALGLIKEGGVRSLFKGYTACLFRAVVGNALGFMAYEETQHLF